VLTIPAIPAIKPLHAKYSFIYYSAASDGVTGN